MGKKGIEFEYVCQSCGKNIEPQSINSNWAEIPTVCPFCNGKVEMKIKGE